MKNMFLSLFVVLCLSGFYIREGVFIDVAAFDGAYISSEHIFTEEDVGGTCAGGPCIMSLSAQMNDPLNHNSGGLSVTIEKYNSSNELLSTDTLWFWLGACGTFASLTNYPLYANEGERYVIKLDKAYLLATSNSSAYNGVVLGAVLSQQ